MSVKLRKIGFDPPRRESSLARSGRVASFPEIDRAEWMTLDRARTRLVKGQVPALDALAEVLAA